MYLATVTCNRDFQQMLLQAESIERFLNPCKHIIIVNESHPDLEFWNRWLSPYYKNHELVIRGRIEYSYPATSIGTRDHYGEVDSVSNGWRTQQLQKMLLAYEYDDDYLLLDSKNFFIKPTDLHEWENTIGSGTYSRFGQLSAFVGTYKNYVNLFGKEIEYCIGPYTPFKVKREPLVNKCKIGELGYNLFYPEYRGAPASEGIFYSFFVEDEIAKFLDIPFIKSKTVWLSENLNLATELFSMTTDPTIKVAAIHREILSKIDSKDLKIIELWLNNKSSVCLGFTNKIHPMPRDSHV